MTQAADLSHPRTGIWRRERRSHSNRSEEGHRAGGMHSHSPRLNQAAANSEYAAYEQQRPTRNPQGSTIPQADPLCYFLLKGPVTDPHEYSKDSYSRYGFVFPANRAPAT